jgi:hypothetical protein
MKRYFPATKHTESARDYDEFSATSTVTQLPGQVLHTMSMKLPAVFFQMPEKSRRSSKAPVFHQLGQAKESFLHF